MGQGDAGARGISGSADIGSYPLADRLLSPDRASVRPAGDTAAGSGSRAWRSFLVDREERRLAQGDQRAGVGDRALVCGGERSLLQRPRLLRGGRQLLGLAWTGSARRTVVEEKPGVWWKQVEAVRLATPPWGRGRPLLQRTRVLRGRRQLPGLATTSSRRSWRDEKHGVWRKAIEVPGLAALNPAASCRCTRSLVPKPARAQPPARTRTGPRRVRRSW